MDVWVDASFGLGEKRGLDVLRQILGGRRVRGFETGWNAVRKVGVHQVLDVILLRQAEAAIGGDDVDVEQIRNGTLVLDVPMVHEVSGELLVQRAIAVVSVE
eukprot:3727921-Pleurochrysis_carterae.AAC.1